MTNTNGRRGDLLLVGSVPFADTETAMREVQKAIGPHLAFMPDGETDDRRRWTGYLPLHAFSDNDQLIEMHRPGVARLVAPPREGDVTTSETAGDTDASYWHFKIAPDAANLDLSNLGYSGPAIDSYSTFRRLREEGVVSTDTRFQVALPGSSGAVDMFFGVGQDWPKARDAYERAVRTEIERILEVVPAADLVVQFDLAGEVTDLANGAKPPFRWAPDETWDERFERHVASVAELAVGLPAETGLGLHWCYGTWGGWPMVDMEDVGLCVDLSNATVSRIDHHVDYVHMPVVPNPDETFLAPLARLDIGDTKTYLGFLHEGLDEASLRTTFETARKFLPEFGIASVCGFGRIDESHLPNVMAEQGRAADLLHETRG